MPTTNFRFDSQHLTPCTITVNTDWARVVLPVGASFLKDPAAEQADKYSDVEFDAQAIEFGRESRFQYVSKEIP